MDDETRSAIINAHRKMPEDIRYPLASEDQLLEFENQYGQIPEAFRWYLSNCGGGVVGSEWVDGVELLAATHLDFARDRESGFWELLDDVFVIGRDKGGNFFGIHGPSGRVVVEDHDVGGLHEMAPSFKELLVSGLLIGNGE